MTTSTGMVDVKDGDVDAAIRDGRGRWAGLRADWLTADHLFPVCGPALLRGDKPLRMPADLAHHTMPHTSAGDDDNWRPWLIAAGPPTELATHRGLSLDMIFTTLRAAIDGFGVAVGRTTCVEADLAHGRLVVPFEISLPADAGFLLVAPANAADLPTLAAFRNWLLASVPSQGLIVNQNPRQITGFHLARPPCRGRLSQFQ